jgi:hypothetical protein
MNDQVASLDDVLNGEEVEITAEPIVVEEAAKPDETGDKPVEETAEDNPEVEEPTPEASPAPEATVPVAAITGERERRQAAEKERDELRAKLEETEKTPPTSVFTDEAKFREEISQSFDHRLTNQSLNQSEFFAAREIGRDVLDAKIEVFKDLAENNAEIRARFAGAVSPYHELIDIVDQHEELEKMKDIDGYKARIRAEEREKIKAELEAEEREKAELRNTIPDSLVGDKSAGGLTGGTWDGPPSTEELFDN